MGEKEQNSHLSDVMRLIQHKEQYDTCAKKLLSERVILAWILKTCVDEFKDCSIEWIMKEGIEGDPEVSVVAVHPDEEDLTAYEIRGENVEDNSIKDGKVFFDIRFQARAPKDEEIIQLIINIEAQRDEQQMYPLIKRGIYYACRMISSQKNTVFQKSHYEKIRKVYSIWVIIKPESNTGNSISEYSIAERQVVGNACEKKSDYDLLSVSLIRLGNELNEEYRSVLRLLGVLFKENKFEKQKEILENEFGIPMTVCLKEEVNEMCNLGEGIYEDGIEAGLERGIERGVMKLLSKHFSAEEVADLLEVDIEKVRRIEEKMLVEA